MSTDQMSKALLLAPAVTDSSRREVDRVIRKRQGEHIVLLAQAWHQSTAGCRPRSAAASSHAARHILAYMADYFDQQASFDDLVSHSQPHSVSCYPDKINCN